jgi:transcriptional regulator
MFSDTELEIATVAYLRARGWDEQTIERMKSTKDEVRERMKAALDAIAKARGEA